MTRLTISAHGSATPAVAWERYADPARWSEWSPQIRRVELNHDRIAAGATGRVHGLLGLTVEVVILDVDEQERRWSWRVHLGPATLNMEHAVDPTASGCLTRLAIRGPAPVVLGYVLPARIALGRLVKP